MFKNYAFVLYYILICAFYLSPSDDKILSVIKMTINYNNIGLRIGQRRRELKMTQKDVAELIGVTDKYISNLETGKRNVNMELLAEFCNILDVTPDYLLLGNIKKDIDSNIIDELKICSQEDKSLIFSIVEICSRRHINNN